MALFKVNIPTLSSAVSQTINPEAAGISGFQAQDFSLPSTGKLAAEAVNKLQSTGQVSDFTNFFNGGADLGSAVQSQVPASSLPSSGTTSTTTQLKVTISQSPEVAGGPNKIVFTVMPRIDESGGAEYEAVSPLHHPGAIQKYRYTTPRTWSVSGRLISRTSGEATENLFLINMIRAWRMPFFGEGTANSSSSAALGAPPPILTLSAYGASMIGPVKCVLTSYNWAWPNDVDYIPTADNQPFPVIIDISLSLTESWSPSEFSGFDIVKFKAGDLSETGAFKRSTVNLPPTQTAGTSLSASEAQTSNAPGAFTDYNTGQTFD